MPRNRLRILWWLALPVALLLAGVATYFLGGAPSTVDDREPTVLVSTEATDAKVSKTLLFSWPVAPGSQPTGTVAGTTVYDLETIKPGPDGTLLVVDHPGDLPGARARWVDQRGAVIEEVFTPPGSTLFTPLGTTRDLAYVIAKQTGPSEQLVINRGGLESTYTVPMQLNSGSILEIGDTIYVSVLTGTTDMENNTAHAEDALLPVVRSGLQVDDATAADSGRPGTMQGADGKLYQYSLDSAGLGAVERREGRLERLSDGQTLRIPDSAKFLGVDRLGRAWLALPPGSLDRRERFLAASPASMDAFSEVLVTGFDGKVSARLQIPLAPRLATAREPYALADGRLYAATREGDTLSIWQYEVTDR